MVFLAVVFLLDKVFLLDYFEEKFLQTGNPVFYHHRKTLFERLTRDTEVRSGNKKFLLTLGDSRSYPYSDKALPEDRMDQWSVYNFSGPQAVPMYSLYWLERILAQGIRPQAVILSLSPEAFDDSKGMVYDPFLRLGSDDEFRTRYWDQIPWKDRYEYYVDRIFAFRRLRFDYRLFLERWRSGKMYEYDPALNQEMMILNMGKGEYLAYASVINMPNKLKKDALRIESIYLQGFRLGETQFGFVEKILSVAKAQEIPVVVVWPRVFEDYRKNYVRLNLEENWWKRVESLSKQYGSETINYNREGDGFCDQFNDASHQSIYCFKDQMADVLRKIEGRP